MGKVIAICILLALLGLGGYLLIAWLVRQYQKQEARRRLVLDWLRQEWPVVIIGLGASVTYIILLVLLMPA